jgi:hypothetical protein
MSSVLHLFQSIPVARFGPKLGWALPAGLVTHHFLPPRHQNGPYDLTLRYVPWARPWSSILRPSIEAVVSTPSRSPDLLTCSLVVGHRSGEVLPTMNREEAHYQPPPESPSDFPTAASDSVRAALTVEYKNRIIEGDFDRVSPPTHSNQTGTGKLEVVCGSGGTPPTGYASRS